MEKHSRLRLVGGTLVASVVEPSPVIPPAVREPVRERTPLDPSRYDVAVLDEDPRLEPILRKAATLGLRHEDSIEDGGLVCLIDGTRRKMLARHLRAAYGMTFETYARFFRLPGDYPTHAPAFQAERKSAAAAVVRLPVLEAVAE